MDTAELSTMVEREYKNQVVSISNSVIRSREYTNLLESKIEVLAIYYMDSELKQKEKTDPEGNKYKVNYVDLTAADIRNLMGRNDGKSYTDIRKAAIRLEEKLYIIEDRENHKFVMQHMYGDIIYNRGILSIEFGPGMEKYFLNLKDNFTKLRLPILFSFKKNGGFQLYKLLKSYAYPPNLEPINMSLNQDELPFMPLSWSLTDLRMMMGYVDITQDSLRDEGRKSRPNFEKMAKSEKNPQYKRWADFKKRVIDPGVEEINSISDIYIKEIKKNTSGHGGKVTAITFVIQHNKAYYEKNQPANSKQPTVPEKLSLTEEQIDDFVDEMRELMKSEGLKTKDLKVIAEASNYDLGTIKKQYEISKSANINNFVGWMIAAVKTGYENPKESKRVKQTEDFERTYDMDELEQRLLERTRIKHEK